MIKRLSSPVLAIMFLAIIWIMAPPVQAQETPAGMQEPQSFGLGAQTTFVYVSHFLHAGTDTYFAKGTAYLAQELGTTPPDWVAQLDLPNGVELQRACFLVDDSDDSASWSALIIATCEAAYDDASSPICITNDFARTNDAETPGYTRVCMDFSPAVLVRSLVDLDSDGVSHRGFLMAEVQANGTGSDLGFLGVSLTWKRSISPAPASATFLDVPVSHWAFQFVEALAASGITSGCGGRNYCPDQPITRAEMAVYLSAALGLHWPS